MYMHLFAKNHYDFDGCCYDALKFDDNCDLLHSHKTTSSQGGSEIEKGMDTNALADALWRKMKMEQRNSAPYRPYPMRQYICATCGGPHQRQNVAQQQTRPSGVMYANGWVTMKQGIAIIVLGVRMMQERGKHLMRGRDLS